MKARYVVNMILASGLMFASGLAQSVMISYTHNLSEWEVATGSFMHTDFGANTSDSAISFTSINSPGNGSGAITHLQDQVNSGSRDNTVIDFASVTFVPGTSRTLSQPVSAPMDDSHFGFVSETTTSQLERPQEGVPGADESQGKDDVAYSDIPEPGIIALFGIGLIAISLLRSRRRQ